MHDLINDQDLTSHRLITDCLNSEHNRYFSFLGTQAKVGFAAPAWKGQAVVDGDIKEISSADYAGIFDVSPVVSVWFFDSAMVMVL